MVLLHIGVDLQQVNSLGDTPLFLCRALGRDHLEGLLLEKGAMLHNPPAEKLPYSGLVIDVVPERRVPLPPKARNARRAKDLISEHIRQLKH